MSSSRLQREKFPKKHFDTEYTEGLRGKMEATAEARDQRSEDAKGQRSVNTDDPSVFPLQAGRLFWFFGSSFPENPKNSSSVSSVYVFPVYPVSKKPGNFDTETTE
jgi:hypothetical protein